MVAVRAGDRLAYAGQDAAPGAWIPEARAKVLMADVTSKPALIGSAAIGLRRFIDNPMRFVSTN